MPPAHRFFVNRDRVVHETIDGETIIIQLETGSYYSLAGPGAEIWALLAAGRATGEVAQELQQRYETSPDELAEAIGELVRELRREELLEADPEAVAGDSPTPGDVGSHANGPRAPFGPPELKKYTDMQYFLLLDPIHEVDGIGWPNPPGEQTAR